jgi:hypothetical protein
MVPAVNHPKWKELVLGKGQYQFQSLAAKILLSRILNSVKNDMSEANISKCVKEVYEFFVKNEAIAQGDIQKIFG